MAPCVFRRSALAAASALLFTGQPRPAPAAVTGERKVLIEVPLKAGQKTVTVSRQVLTGVGDPAWSFGERDVSSRVMGDWPRSYPYTRDDFTRIDEEPDTSFYQVPKLVYHIDEGAVAALTRYYDTHIPDGSDVLDICSSWVSHFPRDFPARMRSIVGTGISDKELACNVQLSKFVQADLNVSPRLPFADGAFDAVTCCVSFDYLTRPSEVMAEVARVLRPGGRLILSQSNRCFYTKAVKVWTSDMTDGAHLRVLGTYVHFTPGLGDPAAFDISPSGPGTNDPMVRAATSLAACPLRLSRHNSLVRHRSHPRPRPLINPARRDRTVHCHGEARLEGAADRGR